jgi:hypothetical protein
VIRHTNTFGLVVPYSPEYRDLGTDLNNLRAVARAGGGELLTDVAPVFQLPLPGVRANQSLDKLLLVLAILLFPLDVALRRLIVQVADLPAWRAAFQRAPAKPIAAEATVTRLKEHITGVRTARAARGGPPAGDQPPPEDQKDTIEELRARRGR